MPVGTSPAAVNLASALEPAHLELARSPLHVELPGDVRERVARCREFVLEVSGSGRAVYGVTTGFGPLVEFEGRADGAGQSDNTILHHIVGHGELLPPAVTRAAVLARLFSLAQGRSGVSERVVDSLTAMLDTEFAPAVPRLGSVGASGDLQPLAYVAHALRGNGNAFFRDQLLPAGEALARAGLEELTLDGRDALALVNGISVTAAALGLAVAQAVRARRTAELLSALMTDVLGCGTEFTSVRLLAAFGHPDVADTGAAIRTWLEGSTPSGERPLQEAYSIRCTPQLIGAAATSVRHADEVVRRDLNGVSDNPLFFPETGEVVHGGNFFGQPSAFAADQLTVALAQLGNLAERQLDLLVDPRRTGGLPPMLSPLPGQHHALQGVQISATATVAAMRRAATPASVQSLPTNLHNQDVVPFGTQAAFTALDQTRLLRHLHAGLAVALRQAVHVGARRPQAPRLAEVLDRIADEVPPIVEDRPLDTALGRVADLLDTVASEVEGAR
ncbi:HAL/PAL/TAL family ammonia-lyase [Lentzea jiangxiensis]|uniref:Histidine ammonia-lyase/tyrosine ammonia-lyase n=1 Tax=Lentzea jiangxiensis TaxID=641025 RepID=A0A1H0X7Q0_9PSEU|nr:aromatic amino acid ammonia-lyase [Lentzea jiangxiensis]SDP98922.1 histidine ammonia-lyase/tyrosine ammonia-lyase [Lentzea jiangxiensis]